MCSTRWTQVIRRRRPGCGDVCPKYFEKCKSGGGWVSSINSRSFCLDEEQETDLSGRDSFLTNLNQSARPFESQSPVPTMTEYHPVSFGLNSSSNSNHNSCTIPSWSNATHSPTKSSNCDWINGLPFSIPGSPVIYKSPRKAQSRVVDSSMDHTNKSNVGQRISAVKNISSSRFSPSATYTPVSSMGQLAESKRK